MVGYSDSAKDAGRLAASWAQYNAQVHTHYSLYTFIYIYTYVFIIRV
jgi:hypothetical protein